jgi:hypothetical protein
MHVHVQNDGSFVHVERGEHPEVGGQDDGAASVPRLGN